WGKPMKDVLRYALVMALVVGAGGCASKCRIHGVITREGKPLVAEEGEEGHLLVLFVPENRTADRKVYRAETDRTTGKFWIGDIYQGKYRVAIQQFDGKHKDALDHRYDPSKTPLRCEVTRDGQVIDIELP